MKQIVDERLKKIDEVLMCSNSIEKDLIKIIEHYGVMTQLKYFQSEVFELNEAIINMENDFYYKEHPKENEPNIATEIADVQVMLNQFKEYYGITDKQIEDIMKFKIDRQLERIKEENNENND